MSNSSIDFIAAFGKVDKQVHLSYISGVGHPTYKVYINKKEIGSVEFVKLTTGGRPEKWLCRWNDKYINFFTSTDCQILIDIASKHYEENQNDLHRASYL